MQYGPPEQNLNLCANLWSQYLTTKTGNYIYLNRRDVSNLMMLLKLAREASGGQHDDNHRDIAGYVHANEVADCNQWYEGITQAQEGN